MDVNQLRRAMSKSLGQEFFDRYFEKFKIGAEKKDVTEDEAKRIWDHINTMGSMAFNRSHAVSYGSLSYWCCVLKYKFPLEFAAACLRNVKDDPVTTVHSGVNQDVDAAELAPHAEPLERAQRFFIEKQYLRRFLSGTGEKLSFRAHLVKSLDCGA